MIHSRQLKKWKQNEIHIEYIKLYSYLCEKNKKPITCGHWNVFQKEMDELGGCLIIILRNNVTIFAFIVYKIRIWIHSDGTRLNSNK